MNRVKKNRNNSFALIRFDSHNPVMTTKHDQRPLSVRMDAELRQALEESAGREGRSLNTEIVLRLRRTFENPEGQGIAHPSGALEARLAELERRVARLESEIKK